MTRVSGECAAWAIAAVGLGACTPSGPSLSGTPTESDTETDTEGPTEGDTEESSDETTTGPGDPGGEYAECWALPEAEIAGWVMSEEAASIAESTPERLQAMGTMTWQLALKLLDVTPSAEHPTVAMSPSNMAMALGMTYGRYQGDECGAEIHQALGFPEDGDAIHETLGFAGQTLASRALPAEDGEDPVVISVQPSIWTIEDTDFDPGTAGLLQLYGGRAHALTGPKDALPAMRTVINCVVETDTQGMIEDFLPVGQPASDTTSYDAAVDFLQAPWASALAEAPPISFTRDDGEAVVLEAMSGATVSALHHDSAAFSSLELEFRGNALSIMLVVPKPETVTLAELSDSLTAQDLLDAREAAAFVYADVHMPKIEIESSTIDYYEPLGLECPLFTLRSVFHGAAVALDEKGIRAAAATADENWGTGTGDVEPDLSFVVDRPFLFFVFDEETDFVLYSGRYAGT